MKRSLLLVLGLAVVAIAAFVYLQGAADGPRGARADDGGARVLLRNAAGDPVGVAKLTEDDGEVLVRVTVHDLPAGFHGFHVHETGTCTPAGFTSAGFHLDLAGTGSGGTPHPSEAGDLPVLLVNADGSGEARFKTDRFDVADLLAGDGTAFIIHLNPDNYANIPARYLAPPATITAVDQATKDTGDAGGRIACGVVQASD